VKPLDKKSLALLAKKFADGVPEEEFSVAGLQGCESLLLSNCRLSNSVTDLLKHKAQPEAAANGIEAWVQAEREMKERLQKEKEARETREKALVWLQIVTMFRINMFSSERSVGRKHRRRIKSRKKRTRKKRSSKR
jgi:hypothetical protein